MMDHFLPDIKDCDIIVGQRADDSYFDLSHGFMENRINIEDLGLFLHFADLETQTVPMTEKTFSRRAFLSAERIKANEYFPKSKKR